MNIETWFVALSTLLAAGVGAVVAIMYRDFRDRARVKLEVESVARLRTPIPLPQMVHEQVRLLGSFQQWLDDIVKWEAPKILTEGRFELSQLKDLLHLAPQYVEKEERFMSEIQQMRESLQKFEDPPTPDQQMTLSRVRAYWQKTFNEDVFIAYSENPQQVAKRLMGNLDGDIVQSKRAIAGVKVFIEWLQNGLSPQAGPKERIVAMPRLPESPSKPFIDVELLAVNTGRSETLIPERAVLHCGKYQIRLRGYGREYGYDVYQGHFWRIKPNEVAELVFSQDPDHTTLGQLEDLRALINEGNHKAFVELEDYGGRRIHTKRFVLRDQIQ